MGLTLRRIIFRRKEGQPISQEQKIPTPKELYDLRWKPVLLKVVHPPKTIGVVPIDSLRYRKEVKTEVDFARNQFGDDDYDILTRDELDPITRKPIGGDAYTKGRKVIIVVPK